MPTTSAGSWILWFNVLLLDVTPIDEEADEILTQARELKGACVYLYPSRLSSQPNATKYELPDEHVAHRTIVGKNKGQRK